MGEEDVIGWRLIHIETKCTQLESPSLYDNIVNPTGLAIHALSEL